MCPTSSADVIMDKLERLAYWKAVAAEATRSAGRDGANELDARVWKTEDDLFAFFDCFRPNGKDLEKVFAEVVGGDEILQRLLKVYGLKDTSSPWGYFIVRQPSSATPERLVDLTTQHLEKVRQIAHSYLSESDQKKKIDERDKATAAELIGLLEGDLQIKVKRQPRPVRLQPDYDAPETIIYDMLSDWFNDLVPTESDALLMDEAFYSIACDYKIADYLMWPLYRDSTNIEEPFAPYFELWTHGAIPIFERPEMVTVYLNNNSGTTVSGMFKWLQNAVAMVLRRK
jgi:hypothetical protein